MKLWMITAFLIFPLFTCAQAETPSSLEQILKQPDDRIDLVKAQMIIEKLLDPAVKVAYTRKQIDDITSAIVASLPSTPSVKDKLLALRQYLYFPGPWNDNKAFSYDLDDPFGDNIKHKLLSNYLISRKGNCVSMPLLYLFVGQKLGLNLSLSTASNHLFVKFTAADGKDFNVETTNEAASLSDESMVRQTGTTDLAIQSGIYMQLLNKKETVTVMMGVLMEHYAERQDVDNLLATSDLALKYYPKNITAIVYKGTAYALALQKEFEQKYSSPMMIPPPLVPRFQELNKNRDIWYDRADALGFTQPTEAFDEAYKLRIQHERDSKR